MSYHTNSKRGKTSQKVSDALDIALGAVLIIGIAIAGGVLLMAYCASKLFTKRGNKKRGKNKRNGTSRKEVRRSTER